MIASLPAELLRALRLTIAVFIITGLGYPLLITGIAQAAFPSQANGSLISKGGMVVGSSLIGQQFSGDTYFHGRPSATVDATTGKAAPYTADNSGGSNLGPSNQALTDRVKAAVDDLKKSDEVPADGVPVDLVTTDFSGLDPDISVASAQVQAPRVAKARGMDESKLRALIDRYTRGRDLGVFGEPRVNVLLLNLALDNGEGA